MLALVFEGTAPAVGVPKIVVVAVIFEVAVSEDLLRLRLDPPVEQVEVVGGFVDEEGAAEAPLAVPAAEIGGAVVDVEVPVEIHRGDLADALLHQQFLHLLPLGRIAVVERDGDVFAREGLRVEDGLALDLVGGHGFLGDDIAPHLHPLDDKLVVRGVYRGDDDGVRLRLADHLLEVGERRALDADVLFTEFQAPRVDVAQADELHLVGVLPGDISPPHVNAPDAGADKRHAHLGAATRAGRARGCQREGRDYHRRSDSAAAGLDKVSAGHTVTIFHESLLHGWGAMG